jgi:two-component system response regulator AtoC
VDKYREKYKSSVQQLPKDLMETFMSFDWPGNIRQLENTVKRYLILPDSDMTFPARRSEAAPTESAPVHQPLFLKEVGAHAAEQAERELVLRTLEQTNWNRKQAARILNISYKALRNKLKRWNLQGRAASAVLNTQVQQSGH